MAVDYQRPLTLSEIKPGDTATFAFRHWDDSPFWLAGDLYRDGSDGSWCIGSEIVRSPHGQWEEDALLINALPGSVLPDFPGRTRILDGSHLRPGDIAVFWLNDPFALSAHHGQYTFWGEVTLDAIGDISLGRHKLFSGSEQKFSSRTFQYAFRE